MTVTALGYLRLSSPRRAEWDVFGHSLLGAAVEPGGADTTILRLDERSYRIAVTDGPEESVEAIGWEVPDAAALDTLVARLEARGLAVKWAGADETAARQVSGLAQLDDPAGYPLDLFHGQRQLTDPPVVTRGARFVTGELGLGHVVLGTPHLDESIAFYTGALGFRVTDTMRLGRARTVFLRCNARHHSLALASSKVAFVHHIMVEMSDLDAVGYAFDAFRDGGVPISMDLGRHSNDRMFSFYARTPSGFEVEYGAGAILVDGATWTVTDYSGPSLWGHRNPATETSRAR